MNATKQDPISWDPVANFTRNEGQVRESFKEQRLAVSLCTKAINKYLEFGNKFVKCTSIRGNAGSGNTWAMLYVVFIYHGEQFN